jgi:hypothetical protein
MTADDVHKMTMLEKIRAIKVLTPGEYAVHSWIDGNNHNGLVVDTMLMTLASGGKLVRNSMGA